MSDERSTYGNDSCAGDAAAYVLGALDVAEADRFRAHMAQCAVCLDEVVAFERVLDVLPAGAPQYAAPKGLRKRIVDEVRAEAGARQAAQGAPAARRAPGSRWAGFGWIALRPAGALAAVLAAILIALGAYEIASPGGGTQVFRAQVFGSGSAILRVSQNRGELIARDLPAPPPGRIYEVWLVRGTHPPTPTDALFSVGTGGQVDIGVPGSLHGVSAVLVSAEPAGGSRAPTRKPVIVASLG